MHSRIHPPPGRVHRGRPARPRGYPRERHSVTAARQRRHAGEPARGVCARRPGRHPSSRRETTKDAAAAARADPADPPAVPAPPASRTLPAIPNGRQPVPGLRSVPAPDPVPRPSPGSRPHPLPVPDPAPHIPVPTRRWDPAGDGIPPAASRRSIERATRQPSPDEDPTNTDAFFSMNPAERCKALVQRNDRLEDRLERAHTELRDGTRRARPARVSPGGDAAQTSRVPEGGTTRDRRDSRRRARVRERRGRTRRRLGKAPIRRRGSRGAERWGDDVHGALRVGDRARVHPTERLHGAPASTPGSETARHGSSARRPRRGSKDVLAHHRTYEDGAGEVARRPGAVAREAMEKSFAPARRPGRPSGSGRGAGGRGRGRGRGRSRKRGFGSEEELDVESSFSEESEEEEEAHRFERDASALDPEAAAFATGETALRGERVRPRSGLRISPTRTTRRSPSGARCASPGIRLSRSTGGTSRV